MQNIKHVYKKIHEDRLADIISKHLLAAVMEIEEEVGLDFDRDSNEWIDLEDNILQRIMKMRLK